VPTLLSGATASPVPRAAFGHLPENPVQEVRRTVCGQDPIHAANVQELHADAQILHLPLRDRQHPLTPARIDTWLGVTMEALVRIGTPH